MRSVIIIFLFISASLSGQYDPNQAYEYFNEAITYFKAQDFRGAIASYSKAISIDPAYTKAYYNRANAKMKIPIMTPANDNQAAFLAASNGP